MMSIPSPPALPSHGPRPVGVGAASVGAMGAGVMAEYQWANIKITTGGEFKLPRMTELKFAVYCRSCRKRQSYIECSKCGVPVCALCSWTVSVPPPGRNGVVDERCRGCVDK